MNPTASADQSADQIQTTTKVAKQIQTTLLRLGWDESHIEYRSGDRWTDENLDTDQNRLAVFRMSVRIRWAPGATVPYAVLNPIDIQSVLDNHSLTAFEKVGRIFRLCGGVDWSMYFDQLAGGATNAFLASILAG